MDAAAVGTLVFVGLVSPVLAWLAGILIQGQKNRRAYVMLRDEELVFPGSTFSQLFTAAGTPLLGAGRIAILGRKRILVESLDGGQRIPLTPLELAAMHLVWTTTDEQIAASIADGSGEF